MNNTVNTICISGGGLKGLSFVSALNVLIQHNYFDIKLINKFVGTSFGAIFAFLLNIGYTPEELITYLNNLDKKKLSFDLNLDLFLVDHGFSDGNNFLDFIYVLFELKTRLKDINFKDLEILTKKKLLIITTNFTKGSKEVFSSDTTPNVSVITAIRMTIAVPLLMTPVKFNDCIYVDGCITSNLGIEFCEPKTTICIYLQKPKKFLYDNLSNIINGLFYIAINTNRDTTNYIKLEIIQPDCSNFIDNNDDVYKNLIDIGVKSGLKFLKKIYLNKIKLIQNEIVSNTDESLELAIEKIEREIEKTDIELNNICVVDNSNDIIKECLIEIINKIDKNI